MQSQRAFQIVQNIVSAKLLYKGRQPQLYLRFKTNCCDEKSAIYFTLFKL